MNEDEEDGVDNERVNRRAVAMCDSHKVQVRGFAMYCQDVIK